MIGRLAADRNLENRKHGSVKAPASFQVGNDKLNVIDQTASVNFLCFHR
jgi:hypothetical protein